MSKRSTLIAVRLTAAERRSVQAEAKRRHVAVSVVIREALQCYTRKSSTNPCIE